jgi:hypothetical protein
MSCVSVPAYETAPAFDPTTNQDKSTINDAQFLSSVAEQTLPIVKWASIKKVERMIVRYFIKSGYNIAICG